MPQVRSPPATVRAVAVAGETVQRPDAGGAKAADAPAPHAAQEETLIENLGGAELPPPPGHLWSGESPPPPMR